MLLAIDTSTNQTGLACYDATGLLGECAWHSGRDHSVQLLPQLTLLLRHLGRSRDSISAVPIIGVGTLEALLYQHERPGAATVPLIRLGRERFATSTTPSRGAARTRIEPRNVTLAEVSAETTGRALFCGDVDADVQAALRELLGARALFPTAAARARRPGYLAELAWQRLQAGDTDNLATLEPIYLGEPVRIKT
jgi:tRNA threonylcarbamoyladenosine biosynthesis protein TsaB